MWLIINRTPYAAERNWIRDKHGAHWWLVAVRGTFTVDGQGGLSLADFQQPPVLEPQYFGKPGRSSLRYDSDLLERKPSTDVLVLASAYAPGGRPTTSVMVTLRCGPLEKQLVLHGNRVYRRGVAGNDISAAHPFVSQPIRYEFAFGGGDSSHPEPSKRRLDQRNPIGRGFPEQASVWHEAPAHHIEYPAGTHASAGPAGFGPIDRAWLPRRTLAGTYDEKWSRSRWPLLPDDYDQDFAMCAPRDQRTQAPLSGGERVMLSNMTRAGTMTFELPRVDLRMISTIGRKRHQHSAQMVSVTIEPDEQTVSVVWQSSLRVPAPEIDYLHTTYISVHGATR